MRALKKKYRLRVFVFSIMIMILNALPTYAANVFYWNGIEIQEDDGESIILPEGIRRSQGQVRGNIISTGVLDITNEGKGKVGLTIQTIAHVRCDRICNALTLEKWNDSTEDWDQVLRYEFEALQEDNPDEKLTYLINGVDVENLQPGTYRARGLHAVYVGTDYEGYSSRTNGIQVTKY